MLTSSNAPLDIDLLILPETNLILIASVIEPLRGANRIAGSEIYRWRLFTPDGAPVQTTSNIQIPVDAAFRPARETTPLFVLGAYNWQRSATPALKMQLSQTARYRTVIAGIESGTWLLAEASLLDNVAATTHWEDFDDFAAAYPQVRMVRERFVIDGKRITTGGSLPTVDLMLEIIRRRQGYSLALEVTRLFIYEQAGSRSNTQVMPSTAALGMNDPRVAHAVRLMEETVEQPLSLARLARRAGLSARHLQTLFRESVGVAPHVHYLALRLNAARRKVIETPATFADIAAATGFNSASAFSRSYRTQFAESPSQTRNRIGRRV
ncbi:GlxA family transcriptional regulator [Rhizobium sp. L245/93]|uniref:GlxA family transcriptional regulator n=1 Tax=Rhizobium sp. L245/93 TaxID=2819998 RepID=UPI001ADADAED|nr:GlxA family transcriptional regulator [Rhizobium sp. L245/93]MBO9171182.1 GlxA family transcriptional regulator [Rhizobium sp. L245/93]